MPSIYLEKEGVWLLPIPPASKAEFAFFTDGDGVCFYCDEKKSLSFLTDSKIGEGVLICFRCKREQNALWATVGLR